MMRSNRPFAAAAARKSHASHTPCEHQFLCSHGLCEACESRAVVAVDGWFDRVVAFVFGPRAAV
eukprot:7112249-Lingulodinium_polyedra.AAC.1